jgi:nucleoside-diphosphate-sugar epimerase
MLKVLVAGGSGFIGVAVLRAFKHEHIEVHATYNSVQPEIDFPITWHKTNLLDAVEVDNLFKKVQPQYLIQLAWCTGQGSYWTDEANFEWLSANLMIARSFVRNGGVRCLFAGTSAEYDWSVNYPLHEVETPLKPTLLYGGSKLALYWALTRYFEQVKTAFVWARFFNPFGEGEDSRRLIPKTCFRLLSGAQLSFDAAMSERDFLHVTDVGEAVVYVLLSSATGPVNVGSGNAVTVRSIISMIAQIYGKTKQIEFAVPDEHNQNADMIVADTTRLNNEIGWTPTKTFEQRIHETSEWWKQQYKSQ